MTQTVVYEITGEKSKLVLLDKIMTEFGIIKTKSKTKPRKSSFEKEIKALIANVYNDEEDEKNVNLINPKALTKKINWEV
jgi:ribosomal protein S24E